MPCSYVLLFDLTNFQDAPGPGIPDPRHYDMVWMPRHPTKLEANMTDRMTIHDNERHLGVVKGSLVEKRPKNRDLRS